MGWQIDKLTVLGINRIKAPGYHGDGGGLYLQVSPSGSKSWVFRFKRSGRAREMGLGSLKAFTLAEARKRAREQRQLLSDGVDPIRARKNRQLERAMVEAKAVTFRKEAASFIESQSAGWKSAKHAAQWTATLTTYVYPTLGDLNVADIDTVLIVACLRPVWATKTETARRLRGRIEKILDFAKVQGHRSGDNPARWRGHLEAMLPDPNKVAAVTHHAALPYASIAAFLTGLRAMPGHGARALEFVLLTAARSGEVRGAAWNEMDLTRAMWTVPAERMKAKREHRVPLSTKALELLRMLPKGNADDRVFPGFRGGQLSDMTLSAVMRRMKVDAVPHGFRSTFRDWCAEQTSYPAEVAEMALAHAVGDKVEAAYRRGDLLAKRIQLMQAWSDFCGGVGQSATVVPSKRSKAL